MDPRSGHLCGICLSSLVADDIGHITQVCVSKAVRGHGVGYELLRRSLDALASKQLQACQPDRHDSESERYRRLFTHGFHQAARFFSPRLGWLLI